MHEKTMNLRQRLADYGLVLAIGFFGLVAQTLLFRDFLTVCEGNELGMASFFCAWLIWVAAGALVARLDSPGMTFLGRHFSFLPLLYTAAYLLQAWLIRSSRQWAGIQTYELFAFGRMLPVSLVVNAPVSFCTGFLFTLACRWLSETHAIAVARVYAVESAGSFAGGMAVTLFLVTQGTAETAFLLAAGVLAAAVGLQRLSRSARATGVALLILAVAVPMLRPDRAWTRHNDTRAWQRFFPGQRCTGHFVTPQARYLYGEYRGQFIVVAWNSIAETVPATESASRVIALHLAQQPAARRFLVIGPASYAICRRLLELPRLESVTWLTPDPDYARRLMAALPAPLRTADPRMNAPTEDVRSFLQKTRAVYDAVILDLPDVTTLALNRYFTREFFVLLKSHVAPSGIVGVRVSGGENFMGDELINAGASVFQTLGVSFRHLAVKPGDESWIIGSDGDQLGEKPALLRDRFQAIKGADAIYPPEGLLSLYLPDRSDYQRAFYAKAAGKASRPLLVNTDRRPKALLHALLFSVRQTGASPATTRWMGTFALSGLPIVFGAVVLYAVARFLYLAGGAPRGSGAARTASAFDRGFMVFSTGAVGMSANLLLMYLYQSAFGSIFLHIGLISALFMLGLAVGSAASERALVRRPHVASALLPAALVAHALLLGAVAILPVEPGHTGFVALFLASGLLSGVYVPVAAAALKREGTPDRAAGAWVESLDHLGGALGGMLTGLALIPLFGGPATPLILALLLLINLPPLLAPAAAGGAADPADRFALAARPIGYTLVAIAAFLLLAAVIMERAGSESLERRLERAVRRMAPGAAFTKHTQALPDGSMLVYFAQAGEGPSVKAYGFGTDWLAPEVMGYAGPIALAVLVDAEGAILDLEIIRSNETPAYLAALDAWLGRLKGQPVFDKRALANVDAVTGATLSSRAIRDILRQAGGGFAAHVLGRDTRAPVAKANPWRPGRDALVLGLLIAAAFALRAKPHRNLRRLVLLAALVVCGIWLNLQYSLAHALSLASGKLPPAGLTAAFLLTLGIPLFAALFGNFYCGYLCPFGALQELLADLRPAGLRTQPAPSLWRWTRRVKYLLLFVLVALYAVTLDPRLASPDPLVTVFSRDRTLATTILALALLMLAFLFNRFWCRVLCPAGAWLALVGGMRAFRRLSPVTEPALCVYGVESRRELDCIGCDRCRRIQEAEISRLRSSLMVSADRRWPLLYGVAVGLTAVVILSGAWGAYRDYRLTEAGRSGTAAGGSQVRDVALPKLRAMIRDGQLSDHKALYWKPAPP
jgi:spermidine synthase